MNRPKDFKSTDMSTAVIGLENCKNITVIDASDEVVAVVSKKEIIEKRGYKVFFDVGEQITN